MTDIAAAGDRSTKGPPPDGEYLRIGDLARMFEVTPRALRFYENKGLITPRRVGSRRLYSRRDTDRLKWILLGRKAGFSLSEVKQMLDLYERKGAGRFRILLDRSERQLGKLERQRALVDEAMRELRSAIDFLRRKTRVPRRASGAA